jgi:hypothetical protein
VVEDDRSSGFSEVSAAKAQHGQKQWMILTSVAGSYQWILIGEFIGTTSLGKASALLSSIPRLYNSPRGERKKPKYMSLFFL